MKPFLLTIILLIAIACTQKKVALAPESEVFMVLLGITQDAGYPQIDCQKSCCTPVWQGEIEPEKVVSLGLVDKVNNKVYLFDATPDFKEQLHILLSYLPGSDISSVGGIFLTHAHIGHYTGLMQLGREALGADRVPVYVMPRMQSFLKQNGPWSQLVSLKNINLKPLHADSVISLSAKISIKPFIVPHRDEYAETVGYHISTGSKAALFIPDIDKWSKWKGDIIAEVKSVDYAFLDATFYSENELPGRDMREIPHPFVPETMQMFNHSADSIKSRIVFIHFNHTNPLLHDDQETKNVVAHGFQVGREGALYILD
jgi:pyrroloquinoline quinone biosynthesis protein B